MERPKEQDCVIRLSKSKSRVHDYGSEIMTVTDLVQDSETDNGFY